MPWTLSHPAVILPLRRLTPQPLNFVALVIGSMTPDLGYYINRFDLSTFAHTWPGSFLVCVPSGLFLLLVFYLFCKPVTYLLPTPHRPALLSCCPVFPTRLLAWLIILGSLLLGAWTHNFWDAFTHEHGWFVVRIPWLQAVAFHLGSTTVHIYLVLQELCTLVGFLILLLAYRSWLGRQVAPPALPLSSDAWRYLFWASIGLLSLLVALPAGWNYAAAVPLHGFLFYRSVVFRVAIYGPLIATPLVLLGASVCYVRRPKEAEKQGTNGPF